MKRILDKVGFVPAIFMLLFAVTGGLGGMSFGIAAAGSASDGSLFMAIVFGLIGFLGASWLELKFRLSRRILIDDRHTRRLLK